MKKNKHLKSVIAGAALCSLLVAPMFLNEEQSAATELNIFATPDFGVGQGIEWPEQVVSPYVDMTAYTDKESLSTNGALNLAEVYRQTGQRFFNLAFMQARGIKDGRIDWAWGSNSGLSESDNDQWQYEGIKQSIRELREAGGDAALSFGGLNSGAFWEVTQDEDMLYNGYKEIVEGYGLTRIDFDVEAGAMGYAENLANAKAVKRLQDSTGVAVTLTLPVMDTGLISTGLTVLQAYLEAGVDLTNVNIMTMCYGESVPDYALGSMDAVDNTMVQLKNHYQQYAGISLTDEQAYAKLGTTPSVGFESEQHPYFTSSMMKQVVNHAKERKIGMVSYWSMNRDAQVDGGQGQVHNQFEFLNASQWFTDDSELPEDTEKPTTPENLTSSLITSKRVILNWEASSDNDWVTKYNLQLTGGGETISATSTTNSCEVRDLKSNTTYTVEVTAEDRSGNVSDAATYTFTTLDDSESIYPEWDAATVYYQGDRVTYEGLVYEAKYWTQNEIPSESGPYGAWKLVTK
ncbi:hypothetical protein A5844_002271 [Enterococcus sp. 10A9_DIV0425]|uniref:Fibronectin type-III domain-containing protein n=1 Tax=Candidatus Enterococcus wittei TaxID=1987383 RepID=A0A242JXS0_9ENTE|nr:carbohydrate-binding protein [Enterococcus sp. 10A9_DIV0425]OTP09493.1 hypothetical protein A5844_002271 [Enterococcus sp. 10A9_DIV0425]THE09153.1 chitinase [Enterococcus hirae]